MKINKARVTKGDKLEVTYIDDEGNDITLKGCNKVHPDLKTRLGDLVPFLADITEQREASRIDWDDLHGAETIEALHNLSCTGVSISAGASSDQVVLVGKRMLLNTKVLNIVAPLTGLDMEDETYDKVLDLNDAVRAFLYEVELYVKERKWAVDAPTLPFPDNDDPFAQASVTANVELPDSIPA